MKDRSITDKLKTMIEKRWDLLLLLLYCAFIIIINQHISYEKLMVISIPIILYGSGYSVATMVPIKKGLSMERHALCVIFSISFTFLIASLVGSDSLVTYLAFLSIVMLFVGLFKRSKAVSDDIDALFNFFSINWNVFLDMDYKKRYAILVSVSILILLLISVWSIATTPPNYEKFTEFYVTGTDRRTESIPKDIYSGENYSVLIGIVNHEKRIIDYQVQIWLISSITDGNWTKVNNAYFVHNFSIRLLSRGLSQDDQWNPQFETKFTFNVNVTGTYKLIFFLSKRGNPVLPTNLTPMVDYVGGEIENLTNQARESEIQSVNFNLYIQEQPQENNALLIDGGGRGTKLHDIADYYEDVNAHHQSEIADVRYRVFC